MLTIEDNDLQTLLDALDGRLWSIVQIGAWDRHHPKRAAIQRLRDQTYQALKKFHGGSWNVPR
jgi:hypothetical protein